MRLGMHLASPHAWNPPGTKQGTQIHTARVTASGSPLFEFSDRSLDHDLRWNDSTNGCGPGNGGAARIGQVLFTHDPREVFPFQYNELVGMDQGIRQLGRHPGTQMAMEHSNMLVIKVQNADGLFEPHLRQGMVTTRDS